jgi:sugar-specific transcriptional regulator TrmB
VPISDEDNAETLEKLGLTNSQARVYIAAANLVRAKAKDIWKQSGVGRQEVYRILSELSELGLIEKEIATPVEFNTIPLSRGAIILLDRKRREISELEKKAKIIIGKNKINPILTKQESQFIILRRKYLMDGRGGQSYGKAQKSIDMIGQPIKRLIEVLSYNYDIYLSALSRGVQIRLLTEKPNRSQLEQLRKGAAAIFSKLNFELKFVVTLPEVALSIIDHKEAYSSLDPCESLFQATVLWTNNPSFIILFEKYFETFWNSALTVDKMATDDKQ